MVLIKKSDLDLIEAHCRACLPNEACGLLGGIMEDDRRVVERVYMVRNMDESSTHFSMDPSEQINAIRDMRENGWTLLGNFHSHPETPCRMSDEDIRLAYDKNVVYLIMSLQQRDRPVLKAFVPGDDNSVQEQILQQV